MIENPPPDEYPEDVIDYIKKGLDLPYIYIAGKFSSRRRIRPYRQELINKGYKVLSNWMVNDPDVDPSAEIDSLGANLEDCQFIAERDHAEVKQCDIFIIDTNDISSTGGREVELGYATALEKTIIRVGPIRNVFHAMIFHVCNDWPAVIRYLDCWHDRNQEVENAHKG